MQNQSMDDLRIYGNPYEVGESAEHHGLIAQQIGTARHTRDYYGVFTAAASGRLYGSSREILVFGWYPPCHVQFRRYSLILQWQVSSSAGGERPSFLSMHNKMIC